MRAMSGALNCIYNIVPQTNALSRFMVAQTKNQKGKRRKLLLHRRPAHSSEIPAPRVTLPEPTPKAEEVVPSDDEEPKPEDLAKEEEAAKAEEAAAAVAAQPRNRPSKGCANAMPMMATPQLNFTSAKSGRSNC